MATSAKKFVICLKNKGYEASLEPLKIYRTIADRIAENHKQLRVIDESGEDYLYPAAFFAEVDVPAATARALTTR